MRLHHSFRSRSGGQVLLAALAMAMVAGLALVVYMQMANSHFRLTVRSQIWNSCLPVAEAGIEEALAHVNQNHLANKASSGWTLTGSVLVKSNKVEDGYYQVQLSQTVPYEIISRGYYPMPDQSTVLHRTIRVIAEPDAMFVGGLVVKNVIDLKGNNVVTDSYDSSDTAKSTLGQYDPLKRGDNGDIASTGGIINVGNANIWGHALTGPTGSISTGPNGAIGSAAWQLGGNTGIEPGWWQEDFNVSFPDVYKPYLGGVPPSSGTILGIGYDYILDSGNYYLNQINGGKILVTGEATLVVDGNIDLSGNSDLIEIAPGAKLTIYAAGQQSRFSSIVNPSGKPTSFSYFGLPTNTQFEIKGTGALRAAIYAPAADVKLAGIGEIYGSVVGKSAFLNGNCTIHYDEALRKEGFYRGIIVNHWDEI